MRAVADARVLVTGGNAGIGAETALGLARLGAAVAITARDPAKGEAAAARIRDAVPGAAVDVVDLDLASFASIRRCADEVQRRFDRLDVLVNNAGGAPPSDTATVSPKFSTAIIALNLVAPLVFAQRAFAVMKDQPEGGVIVNIASVSGLRPSPGTAAYGAAKAGLVNLTQTLGLEFAPRVRVVGVTVGLVRTEQAHLFYGDEAGVDAVGATVPAGRMAEPSDVGDVCLLLASPLARYVTGEHLVVHGGGEWPAYLRAANAGG